MKAFVPKNQTWLRNLLNYDAENSLPVFEASCFNNDGNNGGSNSPQNARKSPDEDRMESDGTGSQPVNSTNETGGTGSGAATNDHGSRIHDIPAGTGSAQRGNRAGMDDEDEGTITGGTAPYSGMGDSETAQGAKLYDHEKEQRKPEE